MRPRRPPPPRPATTRHARRRPAPNRGSARSAGRACRPEGAARGSLLRRPLSDTESGLIKGLGANSTKKTALGALSPVLSRTYREVSRKVQRAGARRFAPGPVASAWFARRPRSLTLAACLFDETNVARRSAFPKLLPPITGECLFARALRGSSRGTPSPRVSGERVGVSDCLRCQGRIARFERAIDAVGSTQAWASGSVHGSPSREAWR